MSTMRGLTVFIADIRKCRIRELEERRINKELAHIRAKFRQGNLNGYSKKKYVCKLLYCYILGWDISFGHAEALGLISSNKYSEKQIGYLAATLLLSENDEMARLVVQSMRKDLEHRNEIFNCLALHAIANIGGRDMAESLAGEVQKLLVSATSKSFVRKKAALCLLRLYRKHPDCIPAPEWAPRILPLMALPDLGVVLAATSLVSALAQDNPESYAPVVILAIRKLANIVVDREHTGDYLYYKVPIPWLQVKLLRILQYFPSPEEPESRDQLLETLATILAAGAEAPRNLQHNNAQNAVLFEAINLAIAIDAPDELQARAATILGQSLLAKQTNLRYLALETMCHLSAAAPEAAAHVRSHQSTVVLALRDKDVSVRGRALDLLYSMCDVGNARGIVAELLQYLPTADHSLKGELVLRLAILVERHAGDRTWYVDTVLQLLEAAGDHVGAEVWHRLVQVIVGTPNVQDYAARTVLHTLRSPTVHEASLKVGAYILGEYGDLIVDEPGCSPAEQFTAIHSKFDFAIPSTRALILSTYLKWSSLFPEIRDSLAQVFHVQARSLDVELQQRACEYLALMDMPTLLETVCEEMPPYAETGENTLLAHLYREDEGVDRRTWVIGGREANAERKPSKQLAIMAVPKDASVQLALEYGDRSTPESGSVSGGTSRDRSRAGSTLLPPHQGDLLDLSDDLDRALVLSGTEAPRTLMGPGSPTVTLTAGGVCGGQPMERHAWHLLKLMRLAGGVLYEDGTIEVTVASEFTGPTGRLSLTLRNMTDGLVSGIVTQVLPHLGVTSTLVEGVGWPSTLPEGASATMRLDLTCRRAFDDPPLLQLAYYGMGEERVEVAEGLRLPLGIWKFQEPVGGMDAADFFLRWHRIAAGSKGEAQATFSSAHHALLHVSDAQAIRDGLSAFGFGVLIGVDPRPENAVGVGVVHAGDDGKVGCLVRIEPNVERSMYRVTVRTTHSLVSKSLVKVLEGFLASGY